MEILWHSIRGAEERGIAIGHFNCAELTVFNAAARAAREADAPIIIGMSEKEREFFNDGFVSILRKFHFLRKRDFRPTLYPHIFFNADHTKSFEKVQEAVEAGFDSITFDGSHLPLEDNIRETKNVVRYIKMVNPRILVEGEVGYIGEGSKLRTTIPKGIKKTTVAEAVRFVKETDVDMLAPAVGNIHGIIKSGEPQLDIKLIKNITSALRSALRRPVPLVLHGASGNSDRDIRAAIKAGISIVHISTEIRVAWRDALRASLDTNPDEVAPYNLLKASEEAAYQAIRKKLKLMG